MAAADPTTPDPWLDRPAWAPAWAPSIDDVRDVRWLRWLIGAVFAASLGACVLESANGPADPELAPPTSGDAIVSDEDTTTSTTAAPSTSSPAASDDVVALAAAFGTITVDLVDAAGEVRVLCLLHADDATERSQGLMGVSDLTGVDGMLFSRPDETTGAFFMFRTVLPLTVGWWGADGAYVGQADMVPCESESAGDCETYPPPGPYRYGLEVVAGDPLAEAFPGSRLTPSEPGCSVG